MEKNAKIYVAGHRGMVGSAIVRELEKQARRPENQRFRVRKGISATGLRPGTVPLLLPASIKSHFLCDWFFWRFAVSYDT